MCLSGCLTFACPEYVRGVPKGVISIPTGRERNLVLIKLYCYVLYLWVFLLIVTEADKHVILYKPDPYKPI